MTSVHCGAVFGVAFAVVCAFPASEATAADSDFTQLSLAELMSIEVVSASRRSEELSDIAAAVYVVTAEDIASSPATTLPELLATIPGFHVAQINASSWAVSARDFNGRFANKLLVMIDGRTIYTPLFSGVFWERDDLVLDDIERIEVIRGPGASVWGANAVNGIINIITKNAANTKGTYARAHVGTSERIATLRQGGALGENLNYRVYAKWREHDSFTAASGVNGNDDWWSATGGFRVDSVETADDAIRVEGGITFAGYGDNFTVPIFTPPYMQTSQTRTDARGGFLAGSWTHGMSSPSAFEVRAYYRISDFDDERLSEQRQIIDIDAQHTLSVSPTNTFVWGGGIRHSWDVLRSGSAISVTDLKETNSIYNAFAQLTSELLDYRLIVTAGTKLEHNDYTGFEFQPTFRALYRVTDQHKIWGAVSRATRTPSRAEEGILVNAAVLPESISPPMPLTELRVIGSHDLEPESLLALEGGYRGVLTDNVFFDIAVYHHSYDDLITIGSGAPFIDATPFPHLVAPQPLGNFGTAKAWGIEAVVNWQPSPELRVEFTYGYVDADFRYPVAPAAQTSPHHQASARMLYQLSDSIGLNLTGRYVGRTPSSDLGDYFELDASLRWRASENIEMSLIGRNLFAGERAEFEPEFLFAGGASMSRPSASIAVNWRN